jgi:hypothetical protein
VRQSLLSAAAILSTAIPVGDILDALGTAAEEDGVLSQATRVGSALKSDASHRSVSWVVDNPAAQRFTTTGGDGIQRMLYQLPRVSRWKLKTYVTAWNAGS